MGAYLSKPVTEKISESGSNCRTRYAATSMQGWRVNQEDAHNCIIDFDENCSFFAVYDGHGGSEVSEYTAKHLPTLLRESLAWSSGDYASAIEDTFLAFDDKLRSEAVLKELKKMAARPTTKHEREDPSDEEEDREVLYEEAKMPLETILQRYGVVLRRDRAGKQTIIDFNDMRKQFEKQDTETDKPEEDQDVKEGAQNKSNGVKKEANVDGHNGDAKEDVDEESDECKEMEEKVVEEKTKKRVCDSSPLTLSPKRTKSSDSPEETPVKNVGELKDEEMQLSEENPPIDKPKTEIADERSEAAEDNGAPASEPEVAGPVVTNASTASSDGAGGGDFCACSSDNRQGPM
ncbi:unnamed protein product [Gongylonema pulchrum]|uniref:protein-serine/threonine phosphatase n=1 Tax=Gongylonema pulchrum TaxID=637853 RepID=A0A183E7C4_9BILA|nr:unnamed protein product [Gongylonema pulchrum]